MSLKDTINNDIKTAMKAKDQASLRALRAIKAAILLAETAEGRAHAPLNPDEELALLTKQAKQRKDSITQFAGNNREDLAVTEREELAIIERYLPKPLSAEALEQAIKAVIEQTGASSMKDMGKVMGIASKQLMGKADGKTISGIVRKILSS